MTLTGDPATFNPALARTGSALEVSGLLFAGLLMVDAQGQFQPDLATGFQTLEGGRRYRVNLRPGLVWSDGAALTSADVVFSYSRVYRDRRAQRSLDLQFKMSAIDDESVEFVLPRADSDFAAYLTLPVLPAHAFKDRTDPLAAWGLDTDPTSLPVSGPFQISRYTPGQNLQLTANPRYWRQPGGPYLAAITCAIVPDRAAALTRFRSGTSDAYRLVSEDYASLSAAQGKGRFVLVNGGTEPPVYLAFNLNPPATAGDGVAGTALRRALALAIDRRQLVQDALFATGEPGQGKFDPKQAKAQLVAAGFKPGQGQPPAFELVVNGDDPLQLRLANSVGEQLKAVGLSATIRPLPKLALRNRILKTRQWQAAVVDLKTLGADPRVGDRFWRSDSPWHFFNLPASDRKDWRASDWERQIDATFDAPDPQAGRMRREQLLVAQQPLIELVRPLAIAAIRTDVREGRFSAVESAYTGRILANIWQVQKAPPADAGSASTPGN